MSCDTPRKIYMTEEGPKLYPPKGHDEPPIEVPCTMCIGCQLQRSFEWGIRAMHEAQMYQSNYFVTMTYSDEHIPKDHSLKKSDHQNFLKKLRRKIEPEKLRYFLCGEYGEQTSRPHYHACLFNVRLDDLEFRTVNEKGDRLYASQKLEETWGKGFVTVGELTMETAMYVAGYTLKDTKIKRRRDEKGHLVPYTVVDPETGEIEERKRPYMVASNRGGGIGAGWFEKFSKDVEDQIVIKHKGEYFKTAVPRYYRKLEERKDPEKFDQDQAMRAKRMNEPEVVEKRSDYHLEARQVIREAKMKLSPRGTKQIEPPLTVIKAESD